MEFSDLVEIVGDGPVFETGMLLTGNLNPAVIRCQLSRRKKDGKISRLDPGFT
jgi:hypothetical protein